MQNRITSMNADQQQRFDQLKKEVSEEVDSLKALSNDEKRSKNDNMISMIRHYIKMTDRVEDRRNGIHTFTLQMLAIWVAAIFVLFVLYFDEDIKINSVLFGVIIAVLITQILFCLYHALIYYKQSSFRYAFLWSELGQYGNKWKWFYYGSEPIQRIATNTILESKSFNATVEPFLESYRDFRHNYVVENLDSEITDNIQQLHLLRVHNYYKNKFYLQLTAIQKWALYAFPVSAAVGALIAFLVMNWDLLLKVLPFI